MLLSGDDPLYVCRGLIKAASNDIGLADPNAMIQAVAAFLTFTYNYIFLVIKQLQ